jgi:hypothetical protein
VHAMRGLDLRKPPSIAETVDWARSLVLLGVTELDSPVITRTLPVLLKNQPDLERAATELDLTTPGQATGRSESAKEPAASVRENRE